MALLGCFYLKKKQTKTTKSLIPRTQQGSVSESGISQRSALRKRVCYYGSSVIEAYFFSGDINKTLQELIKLTQISRSRAVNTVFQLRPNPISHF